MAKEFITHYGPQAKEGDYVLVIHSTPKSSAIGLIGKVYNGKAYTGYNTSHYPSEPVKYRHRMSAECVIPVEWVTDEQRAAIEEDIRISNQPKKKENT